ncbi:hypothetical protein AX15_001562 [Amanita polypyramis BW_CC]|nr:hypothetical protein AX15_001562 [Amanita polypyramis BW_CC]
MDAVVTQRLQHTEEELLDAFIVEGPALEQFLKNWSTLASDIERAMETNALRDRTIEMVQVVAARVQVLSENILAFQLEADTLASGIEKSIGEILASTKLLDEVNTQETTDASPQRTFEPLYDWLLSHLHDPYPTKRMKDTLSRGSGVDVKDIDNWFIETRKKIGWNSLRRSRFCNKRQEIVDAATRFFLKPKDSRPLDPELEMEFAQIMSRVEVLFYERFPGKASAILFDPVIEKCTLDGQCRAKTSPKTTARPPTPSSRTLSTYSLSSPGSVNKKKRPRDGSMDGDVPCKPQMKRFRCRSVDDDTDISTSPVGPSPASISDNISRVVSGTLSSDNSQAQKGTLSLKRKRCLSSSDCTPVSKWPPDVSSGPRLHAVSAPLPTERGARVVRDVPCISLVESPDPSNPVQIDLYDVSQLANQLTLEPSQVLGDMLSSNPPRLDYDVSSHRRNVEPLVENKEFSRWIDPSAQQSTIDNMSQLYSSSGTADPCVVALPTVPRHSLQSSDMKSITDFLPLLDDAVFQDFFQEVNTMLNVNTMEAFDNLFGPLDFYYANPILLNTF